MKYCQKKKKPSCEEKVWDFLRKKIIPTDLFGYLLHYLHVNEDNNSCYQLSKQAAGRHLIYLGH